MRLPDAFRHAYASAFLAYYINSTTAEKLGNLVEVTTSFKRNKLFNSGMDQCNNYSGRQIALDVKKQHGSWREVEDQINDAYKNRALILSKYQYQDIFSCYKRFFSDQTIIASDMRKYIHVHTQKKVE